MLLLTRVAVRAGIWHRGVPNDSPTARPNAVLIYYRKRHQALQKANQKPMQRLMFSESARAARLPRWIPMGWSDDDCRLLTRPVLSIPDP